MAAGRAVAAVARGQEAEETGMGAVARGPAAKETALAEVVTAVEEAVTGRGAEVKA